MRVIAALVGGLALLVLGTWIVLRPPTGRAPEVRDRDAIGRTADGADGDVEIRLETPVK